MNSADLSKILEEHKVWITSMRESGSRADLCGANLLGANLRGADLRGADLRGADLYGADLCGANLRGANLRGANLCGADLRGADLCDANLCDANLYGANLCDANLYGADLCGANLCDANLYGANLPDLTFVILGEKYFISITNGEYVRAGCQNHTVEEWRKYSKQEIAEMDGRKALKFYPRLLDIIDFYIGKGERPDWLTSQEYAYKVTE
ncbi:pentapeptide repeat-containing protein [Salmonella enterica subsp. enterica serovar Thompson]|uniref:pentapeptide repeat-containing protein n=1 Tax=Salmonella TaxID=590 RepID=UPI00094243CA|nr:MULTISPECIES: pentapeptide repeat-containing protein [Salmonella]EGM1726735.1 pentapeptide repeat-containing protein [Salmonella enterica subsp. enterica serovar Singapore]MCL9514670.1 pentapeptide repeat-containing protein [Salmonella enterica subsp. enterica serovar Enteritidis]EAN5895924.1 pentapeptide repeat-containing protein [Salmonella enterica]EAS4440076.1 pentapeptide repeat-containing protein [Salmonella enterica]EAT1451193.1 pentapeptide repeat-containing protein [Salmonella ente